MRRVKHTYCAQPADEGRRDEAFLESHYGIAPDDLRLIRPRKLNREGERRLTRTISAIMLE